MVRCDETSAKAEHCLVFILYSKATLCKAGEARHYCIPFRWPLVHSFLARLDLNSTAFFSSFLLFLFPLLLIVPMVPFVLHVDCGGVDGREEDPGYRCMLDFSLLLLVLCFCNLGGQGCCRSWVFGGIPAGLSKEGTCWLVSGVECLIERRWCTMEE